MNRRILMRRIAAVISACFAAFGIRRKKPRFIVRFDGRPMFNPNFFKKETK